MSDKCSFRGTSREKKENRINENTINDVTDLIDKMNQWESELGDTTKCQTCIIGKYEIPEMWCEKGCIKTDLIPEDKIREDWKRQGREMDYLLEDAPKPKTPYELLMAKHRRHPDKTIWFTDLKCPECGKDIFTDGKLEWCKDSCIRDGMRVQDDKDYMGFVSDLIR